MAEVTVRGLPDRHAARWRSATRHRFLDAVREGSLPVAAFDSWLVQDALFVADLLRFQSRLLARAPRPAQRVLAEGTVALVDELTWFDGLATDRGLDLSVAPLTATSDYAVLLEQLDAAPYPDAIGCLWVLERVYLDAWSSASPAAGGLGAVVEHWTTPGFCAYVAALQDAAEQAGAPAERLVAAVLDQEAAFWEMAWEMAFAGGGAGSAAVDRASPSGS